MNYGLLHESLMHYMPTHQPDHLLFPPLFIKDKLLPALALNVGIRHKSRAVESSSIVNVNPGDTGLLIEGLCAFKELGLR